MAAGCTSSGGRLAGCELGNGDATEQTAGYIRLGEAGNHENKSAIHSSMRLLEGREEW
jgi:hypothetical protein